MSQQSAADKAQAVREEEEKYLAERTLHWIEKFTHQSFSSSKLSLAELLQNGVLLARIADLVELRLTVPNNKSTDLSFTKAYKPSSKVELTQERRGFQNVLDVDRFLDCCRRLGLEDYQLFNASDVTTCGDLLRVCRTVRSLSLACENQELKDIPVFETSKQKVEARRRSMSTEATTTKREKVNTLIEVNTLLSSPQVSSAVKKRSAMIENGEAEKEKSTAKPSSKADWKVGLMIPLGLAAAGLALLLRPKTYVVKKGDTLSSVAKNRSGGDSKKLGKNLRKLQKKNPNIQDKNLIYTSQKIKV
jgi:hypothetical protein